MELEESTCLTSGSTTKPQSGRLIPPVPFFFLKIALAIQGFLHFHTNCEIICSAAAAAAAAAKSLQSCLTLYDTIDGSPPGSPVPEILQARTLEWVAISFSNA